MSRSAKEAAQTLARIAHEQGGYFTTKQAHSAGYGYRHLDYHETAGNFHRVGHGLYRLPAIPFDEHDDLIRLSLWSRDQKDRPQAVVSHETALVLHELSELLPRKLHLTVPKRFRKTIPKNCTVYKHDLSPADIEERQGYRVTTPVRTLLDVATVGISQEQLDKAVVDAVRRGLVRQSKLLSAAEGTPAQDPIQRALRDVRKR